MSPGARMWVFALAAGTFLLGILFGGHLMNRFASQMHYECETVPDAKPTTLVCGRRVSK